jgi:hypothetical protein
MRSIHVGVTDWLVIDDGANPRFLIHYGPAVYEATRETLMMYRVDHWVLERERRWPLGYYETLAEATEACEASIGGRKFVAPAIDPQGRVVTIEEQQRSWDEGRDPRTGQRRQDQEAE